MSKIIKAGKWLIVLLAIHILNSIFGLYWVWMRLDNLMHFLGGAAVAVTFLELYSLLRIQIFWPAAVQDLDSGSGSGMTDTANMTGLDSSSGAGMTNVEKRERLDPRSKSGMKEKMNSKVYAKLILIVTTLSFVALTAVLWEFMEFGMDYFFGVVMQPDLTDTMSDLALGLLGALVVALFKRQKR